MIKTSLSGVISHSVYPARAYHHLSWEFESCSWWSTGVLDITLCDKLCQWLATGQRFSPVSSTNKIDHHNLKVTNDTKVILNIIYVCKLNQTVLVLDFSSVKFLFFPRRDLNPHHWYENKLNINVCIYMMHISSMYIVHEEDFNFILCRFDLLPYKSTTDWRL
jgi:hypothetical protein